MSGETLPPAEHRRSHWPGWIWSVPIAAIGVAIWLGIRSIATSGPTVEVTFPEVANIKAGDTEVKFQDLAVGKVVSAHIGQNLHDMQVRLSLDPSMAGHLGKGTRFWIEGVHPHLTNLASLRAIIGGPSIGIDPVNGPTQKKFRGETQRPVPGFGTKGQSFVLGTAKLGSLQRGTPIFYLGQQVGRVQETQMVQGQTFRITAFIKAPYARLVHNDTRFWKAGPISLQTGGTGPRLDFKSLPALMQGAIAFETPALDSTTTPSANGQAFTLYDDRQAAIYAPSPQAVRYRLRFPDATSALAAHAAVTLAGTRIGSVLSSTLSYDGATDTLAIDAVISVEPTRIRLEEMPGQTPDRKLRDMMRHLVADGLQASLTASPPVLGGETVALKLTPGMHGTMGPGPIPEIPTTGGGDIGGLIARANTIEEEVAGIPFAAIGQHVDKATKRAAQVINSPELKQTLRHAELTTRHLDHMTWRMERAVPPMLARLRRTIAATEAALNAAKATLAANGNLSNPDSEGLPQTLYEVARAARALRTLANFLDQHPQSLLTGYHGRN